MKSPRIGVMSGTLLLLGCGSPTEPPIEEVDATLSGITLQIVELGMGASRATYLEVGGTIPNPSEWLERNHRVRLTATTDAGDLEELLVGPEICDRFYSCHWLTAWMKAGADARVLVEPVERLGGAALSLSRVCDELSGECSETGGVAMIYVFDSADMSRIRGALAWVPGVASVGRSVSGQVLGMPSFESLVHGMFPLSLGAGAAQDGVIQAADGGEVTVAAAGGDVQTSMTVVGGGDPGR